MKSVTKTMFQSALDCTLHETEQACIEHDKVIAQEKKETSYWLVWRSPDCTETGYFMKKTYIKARISGYAYYLAENFILDYCFKAYGRPVDFVQGVSAVPAWKIEQIEKPAFDRPTGIKWGGTMIEPDVISLELRGQELVHPK